MSSLMITKKHYCNMCGKELDMWDEQEGFSIHKKIGYGSIYDGDYLNLNLCCECADKIIGECKIHPIVPAKSYSTAKDQEIYS